MATPTCAIIMPTMARGIWRARWTMLARMPPAGRSRSTRSVATEAMIQNAISSPVAPTMPMPPLAQATISVATTALPAAHFSREARSGSSLSFQRAIGPTPIRKTSGVSSGTNTVSKYGGPTEILPRFMASSASG